MSIESVMPSKHLILCHPFLLPPSIFPRIRVFSSESVLHIIQRRKLSCFTRRERSWARRRILLPTSEPGARPKTPSPTWPSQCALVSAPHCSQWHLSLFRLPLGFTKGKGGREGGTRSPHPLYPRGLLVSSQSF